MPKEFKKRGRREEKKRKREEGITECTNPTKYRKTHDAGGNNVEIMVNIQDASADQQNVGDNVLLPYSGPGELQFYGMLDEQEQEYFKQADSTLELNQFADAEEKGLFMTSLWKEAKGKELKIANSQSCSRLMERLIGASTPQQLKVLWGKFSTHFMDLFQHRFASHCCEALFRKAAPTLNTELGVSIATEEGPDGEKLASMEHLFLSCVRELEDNLGFLVTDQFASHPLRVLLIVLSGLPFEDASTSSLLQSKKKEHNMSATKISAIRAPHGAGFRFVPDSFYAAVESIVSRTTAHLDTSSLRALATHPIANPVLQLLLTIFLSRSSNQSVINDPKSLFRLLVPDDLTEKSTESAVFINHLLYDPIGSRLLEVIVTHAPGKAFKMMFRSLFKERIGSMARNETAAFVVIKVLERLGQTDLESVLGSICDEIETLTQRSRTGVIKTLIERCRVREIDATPIVDALRAAYGKNPAERLLKMLNVTELSTSINEDNMSADRRKLLESTNLSRLNGSLLAQSMVSAPGPSRDLITDSILAMEIPAVIAIAEDRTMSRVLQAAVMCPEAGPRAADQDLKFKREFMPLLYPYIAGMSTHAVASHVVDASWEASKSLKFVREQMAVELLKEEASLRVSVPGRAVWRNWSMDMYKTRRRDWLNLAESGLDAKLVADKEKTGIELARERHAQKTRRHAKARGPKLIGSGANAVAVK